MTSVHNVVADVLEARAEDTIDSWYERVEKTHLIRMPLTRAERIAHLPEMFRDIVSRLRHPLPLGSQALCSDAAHDHGALRRKQGYTPAMMVDESRMLQVSIFQTLEFHIGRELGATVLADVMVIADEVDAQLSQAMVSLAG